MRRFGASASPPTPSPTSPTIPDFAPAPDPMKPPARRGSTAVIDSKVGSHPSPAGPFSWAPIECQRHHHARAACSAAADLPDRLGVRRDTGAEDGAAASLRRRRSAGPLGCHLPASHQPRERRDGITQSRRRRGKATAGGGSRTGIHADTSNSTHMALDRGNDLHVGASGTSAGRCGGHMARPFTRASKATVSSSPAS